MKGFRKGMKDKVLDKAREGITPEELERIKQQREYDSIEPGTFTHKLALHLDALQKQKRQNKIDIDKRMWNITNVLNEKRRYEEQLESGKIYAKLKDDVTMNQYEVASSIKQCDWIALGEVRAISELLADLRSVVGRHDLAKNVILNIQQYDNYVDRVKQELETLGYDIFD